jgi:hypothetical protein
MGRMMLMNEWMIEDDILDFSKMPLCLVICT